MGHDEEDGDHAGQYGAYTTYYQAQVVKSDAAIPQGDLGDCRRSVCVLVSPFLPGIPPGYGPTYSFHAPRWHCTQSSPFWLECDCSRQKGVIGGDCRSRAGCFSLFFFFPLVPGSPNYLIRRSTGECGWRPRTMRRETKEKSQDERETKVKRNVPRRNKQSLVAYGIKIRMSRDLKGAK